MFVIALAYVLNSYILQITYWFYDKSLKNFVCLPVAYIRFDALAYKVAKTKNLCQTASVADSHSVLASPNEVSTSGCIYVCMSHLLVQRA